MSEHASEKETELRLTIIVRRSGGAWIAQCLDHDIAAQGPTLDDCKLRFMRTLSSRIIRDLKNGRRPLADLPPAPRVYYDQSVKFGESGPELPVYVPVNPRLRATARFLGAIEEAPSAQA